MEEQLNPLVWITQVRKDSNVSETEFPKSHHLARSLFSGSFTRSRAG